MKLLQSSHSVSWFLLADIATGCFWGVPMAAAMASHVLASDPDTADLTDFRIDRPTVDNFTFTGFRNLQVPGPGVAQTYCAPFDQSLPGLNGLGLSAALCQFGPQSQIDPHTHPCASEIFYVLSGQLGVGFVDTNNDQFETTLQTGDVFVFPRGLLHWQRNYNLVTASCFSVLSSDNPEVLSLARALFTGGGTGLPNDVLATTFGTNNWEIGTLKESIAVRNESTRFLLD